MVKLIGFPASKAVLLGRASENELKPCWHVYILISALLSKAMTVLNMKLYYDITLYAVNLYVYMLIYV